jgi:phospholipid/cholesterol/gamma-HCH transport system substrate-binding protein
MSKTFKFRHVNEIVGGFVVLAVALIVVAIFFAGRAQGWFEGSFTLRIEFKTAEGSFGLQEGAEVQIRNTMAGKTGKIVPTPDGQMMTTLKIKERFRPFLTKDSIAKIKKKFGVAGDAFVEITRGTGTMIEDGDTIECRKDEELMETAQKMLGEVEKVVLPMLEEVKAILEHVKNILASVDAGQGLAGAAIGDADLKHDIKATIANVERITALVTTSVAEANSLLSNQVPTLMAQVDTIAGHADALLTNQVRRAVGDLGAIQAEAVRTLRETRRLVEGVQRHWLLRKYVPSDVETLVVQQAGPGLVQEAELGVSMREKLTLARVRSDADEIVRTACNLAILAAAQGDRDEALARCREARVAHRGERAPIRPVLVEAMLSLKAGDHQAASVLLGELATIPARHINDTEAAQMVLLDVEVRLAAGDLDGASERWQIARRHVRQSERAELREALAAAAMRMAAARGDFHGVAGALESRLDACREAGMFYTLAQSLEEAGHMFGAQSREKEGGRSLLMAARSYAAQGAAPEAIRCLDAAGRIAARTDNRMLMLDVAGVRRELDAAAPR